jgi:hypothetical protein
VTFDSATSGARFDNAIPNLVKSPSKALGAAFVAFRDMASDPLRLETWARVGAADTMGVADVNDYAA